MSVYLLLLFDVVWVGGCPTLDDELERSVCYPSNFRTPEILNDCHDSCLLYCEVV